jgi:hypothetical protein
LISFLGVFGHTVAGSHSSVSYTLHRRGVLLHEATSAICPRPTGQKPLRPSLFLSQAAWKYLMSGSLRVCQSFFCWQRRARACIIYLFIFTPCSTTTTSLLLHTTNGPGPGPCALYMPKRLPSTYTHTKAQVAGSRVKREGKRKEPSTRDK